MLNIKSRENVFTVKNIVNLDTLKKKSLKTMYFLSLQQQYLRRAEHFLSSHEESSRYTLKKEKKKRQIP